MKPNILLDKLPKSTRLNQKIRTDFRTSIQFELLMQDNNIKMEDKIRYALNLYFYDKVTDIKEAIEEIIYFYTAGKEEKKSKGKKEEKNNQIYSYEFDADYIYSAFLDQYNIDLNRIDYMHWWKFKALFKGLKEDNQIVKIMQYRSVNLSEIKDKNEKKRYQKLKQIYALPDMRTEEEKERDFGAEFWF